MVIHSYYTAGGKDLIRSFIDDLEKDEKVDGYSVLADLENDDLDGLIIKQWQGKVNEVYFKKYNRIFYVTVDGNDIYLLHACKKQKNKTEKTDKNIVIKRAKELEGLFAKKFL